MDELSTKENIIGDGSPVLRPETANDQNGKGNDGVLVHEHCSYGTGRFVLFEHTKRGSGEVD